MAGTSTSAEAVARQDARMALRDRARKSVAFAAEDLNRNLHTKRLDTPLRRRSETRHSLTGAEDVGSQTLDDQEVVADRDVFSYDRFMASCPQEAFDDIRYNGPIPSMMGDLQNKMTMLADASTKNGTTVGVQFVPLAESAKLASPNADGLLDEDRFETLTTQHNAAMFDEFKLRSFALSAALAQAEELHKTAKNLDLALGIVYGWAKGLAIRVRDADDATTAAEQVVIALRDEQHRNAELTTQIDELRGETARLRSSRAGTEVTDMTRGTHRPDRSEKIPDPAVFYGQKSKDTLKFETWHRQVQNKMKVNCDRFVSDIEKQTYVESRLGGHASEALQPYLSDSHPEPVSSYAELMEHLWTQYHDPNQAELAISEFESLQLRPRGDFRYFKNTFVRLAGEIGKAKKEWKAAFNRKLPMELRKSLAASYIRASVTFEDFAAEAAQLSLTLQQADDSAKTKARDNTSASRVAPSPMARSGQPSSGRGAAQPDKKMSEAAKAARKHTPDKLKDLISRRLCINCEKPGHFVADCPEKNRMDQGRINALVDHWVGPTKDQSRTPASNADKLNAEDRVVELDSDSEN